MTKTIYKYSVPIDDDGRVVAMPHLAELLTVQIQVDEPVLWALVNPEYYLEPRRFRWFGTGRPVKGKPGCALRFVGTVQMAGGSLVFHLFEEIG